MNGLITLRTGDIKVSFLQVLSEHCPKMLTENGGKVELNMAWAKSFLRRTHMELEEANRENN